MHGSWSYDPTLIGALVVAVAAYFVAVGPLRRRLAPGAPFPRRRTAWFMGGIAALYLLDGSPLHALAHLDSPNLHAMQHMLLSYVIAPVLLLGLPRWAAQPAVAAPSVPSVAHGLRHPGTTVGLAVAVLAFVHLVPTYDVALASVLGHHGQHLVFVALSLLLWRSLVTPTEPADGGFAAVVTGFTPAAGSHPQPPETRGAPFPVGRLARDAPAPYDAPGAKRRVLLVSDNRDNPNWGSRATTMALLELLDLAGFAPAERVMDAEVRTRVAVAEVPAVEGLLRRPALARLASAALARGGRTRSTLERLGVLDTASDDPEETVRRWRRAHLEPLDAWIARVEHADAVVINGEGSMIFTSPSRLEQRVHLAVMQLAADAGVPFAYVNALFSDPAHGPRNTATLEATRRLLPRAHLVTTRDPWSHAFLQELAPGTHPVYVPDALFAWYGRVGAAGALLARPDHLVPFHPRPERLGAWGFQRPYVCVGGSSEAAKDPERALTSYRRLLAALTALGYPLVVTISSTGDAFLEELAHELGLPMVPATTNALVAAEILAHAELVVTGRYHPAIMAGLGGVPCVLLGADSHKTASVQWMLRYPAVHVFPEQPTDTDVDAILRWARSVLADRERWRAAIAAAAAERADEARSLAARLAAIAEPLRA